MDCNRFIRYINSNRLDQRKLRRLFFFLLAFFVGKCSATASDNLIPGTPGKANTIIDREGYALGYSEMHEQPAWIQYRITAEEVCNKTAKRKNVFSPDPLVPTGSATAEDYVGSGYDRGHLAPAADLAFSEKTITDSFFYSNISPQKPEFNRGVWKRLEVQIRAFAVDEGEIYVVTGPVLPIVPVITIGPNRVTVPEKFYKVVYAPKAEKMLGFIVPNAASNSTIQSFSVTVRTVEKETGLDFFSALPKEKQNALENTISISDWKWLPP